jgi:hypothetical protein
MDLPEIYLEKPGQIFLSSVSGQKSASRSVSHRNNQGLPDHTLLLDTDWTTGMME